MRGTAVVAGAMILLSAGAIADAAQEVPPIRARYALAARFLDENQERYVPNGEVRTHWIAGSNRLWYRRTTGPGTAEFVTVDAASGARRPSFDHTRLARGLSLALGRDVDPYRLPFNTFEFVDASRAIRFSVDAHAYRCSLPAAKCAGDSSPSETELTSPDGQWVAGTRDHNLWIRGRDGASIPLTTDGVESAGYGESSGNSTEYVTRQIEHRETPPQLLWSPDSRHLFSYRIDERQVEPLYLLQSAPPGPEIRPALYPYRYSTPQTEHPAVQDLWSFDVVRRTSVKLDTPPLQDLYRTITEDRYVWWSKDGRNLYFVRRDRYAKSVGLYRADPDSGRVDRLVEDTGKTFVEVAEEYQMPRTRVLANGDFLWFSERDGWAHLYYYTRDGALRNRITGGTWMVRDILRVSEDKGCRIFFTANGREPNRNPYYLHLYSVNCDGSNLVLLTPEDADHAIGQPQAIFDTYAIDPYNASRSTADAPFSPGGAFVDTYSRPNQPPVTVLRSQAGKLITVIERADISPLLEGGFVMPEPVQTISADGSTRLYGTLFKPSYFDPSQRYPVLDSLYPGPQETRVERQFVATVYDWEEAQAIAELGFIVLTLDGRGTPHRSKAFLDQSYGRLGDAGNLDDHIAGLRELASSRPYMDLDRVGAYGHSGGGFAAARAILAHPDFFKVAVASSGDQEMRGYVAFWGDTYMGPDDGHNFEQASNIPLAGNLQGKLLLVHGDMDDNVHPSQTLRLASALIDANKDFDLMILPNLAHRGVIRSPYFIRRRWDYLVRNLRHEEPPAVAETPR